MWTIWFHSCSVIQCLGRWRTQSRVLSRICLVGRSQRGALSEVTCLKVYRYFALYFYVFPFIPWNTTNRANIKRSIPVVFETYEEWPQSKNVPPSPPPFLSQNLRTPIVLNEWWTTACVFFLENHFYSWSSLLFHTEEWGRLSCMIRPKGEPGLEELGPIVFGKKRFQTAHVDWGKNGVRVLQGHPLYSVILDIIDEFLSGK